jgi:NAD(P)-dependent dehydrogenase (short-subunit alcohol dehydrogenase family)
MTRAVIVSGGTSGIGRATALQLARAGDQVLAIGIDPAQHEALAAERDAENLPVTVARCDISDPGQVAAAVADFSAAHLQIDCLVNAAAIAPLGTILDTGLEAWDRAFQVNVRGMFLMTRAVLPGMVSRRGGAIVNVGSGAGFGKPGPRPGFAYSVSKSVVPCFSATLALDYAAAHIRVNTVIAGPTYPVAGNRNLPVDAAARLGAQLNAAGRWTTPDEVAHAIVWLLSDQAATTSGAVLHVGTMPAVDTGIPDPSRMAALVEEGRGKTYSTPDSYATALAAGNGRTR